jgi:S-adenosyl methyltransferase
MRLAVGWNRDFLRRVVRYLVADAGIRQIIDFGAGLPTRGNTHEIALQACPRARVVYVDHDPVVLAHARNMLHNVPGTAIIEQDLTEPGPGLAAGMASRPRRAAAGRRGRVVLLRRGGQDSGPGVPAGPGVDRAPGHHGRYPGRTVSPPATGAKARG